VVVALVHASSRRPGRAPRRALLSSSALVVAACLLPSLSLLSLVGVAALVLQPAVSGWQRGLYGAALLGGAAVLLLTGTPDALIPAPASGSSPWLALGLGLSLLGWLRAAGCWPLAAAGDDGAVPARSVADGMLHVAAVVGLSRLLLAGFGQGGAADALGGWPPVVGAVGLLGALAAGARAALASTPESFARTARGALVGVSLLALATAGGAASAEAGRAALWLQLASLLAGEALLALAPTGTRPRPSLRAGASLWLLSGGPGSPAFVGRVLLFSAVPAWGAPATGLWLLGLALASALPWLGAARLLSAAGESARLSPGVAGVGQRE
jgi:hypothetical protein